MAKTDSLGAYFDATRVEDDEYNALLYAFDVDESEVKHFHSVGLLFRMVPFLRDNPLVNVEVQGFCSNTGTAAHNQVLSEERADNVVKELVSLGIDESRIISKGRGIK